MAIEKDRVAEPRPCVAKHSLERAVIGEIARGQAPARLGAGQQAAIDRRPVGHDARDRAEAAPHPRRASVDPRRKGVGEHRGVELARLAVRVHERPREARRHERRPQSGRAGDQFVDPAVLGTPQGVHVDRHPGEERLAIVPPAMRRGHRHGQRLRDRPKQRDRRIVERGRRGHDARAVGCGARRRTRALYRPPSRRRHPLSSFRAADSGSAPARGRAPPPPSQARGGAEGRR